MGEIQNQIDAIRSAPVFYIAALLVVGAIIWATVHFLYKHRLDGLKEELAKEERENRRIKQKLDEVSLAAIPTKITSQKPDPPQLPRRPTRVPSEEKHERVWVPDGVTTSTLRALFEGRTRLEGKSLFEPYSGKWIRASGVVRDVENDDALGWSVSIDDDPAVFIAATTLYLLDSEGPKVEMLRTGVTINAIGRIIKADKYMVTLEHCILE